MEGRLMGLGVVNLVSPGIQFRQYTLRRGGAPNN